MCTQRTCKILNSEFVLHTRILAYNSRQFRVCVLSSFLDYLFKIHVFDVRTGVCLYNLGDFRQCSAHEDTRVRSKFRSTRRLRVGVNRRRHVQGRSLAGFQTGEKKKIEKKKQRTKQIKVRFV